jgi:hypothetical protein
MGTGGWALTECTPWEYNGRAFVVGDGDMDIVDRRVNVLRQDQASKKQNWGRCEHQNKRISREQVVPDRKMHLGEETPQDGHMRREGTRLTNSFG